MGGKGSKGQAPVGFCSICRVHGPLSFEHIPPAKAFNNKRATIVGFEASLKMHPLDEPKGRYQQKGFGNYLLCEKCNNDTGAWYAGDYVDWAFQAHAFLERSQGESFLFHIYHGYPLRFLKQAIAMFLSVGGPELARIHPDLVRLVKDKIRRYLPPHLQLFAYYNNGTRTRNHTFSARVDTNSGHMELFAEVSAYPFGFILTDDLPPPDSRLYDISYFSQFRYDEWRSEGIRLPTFPVLAPLPGSFFTPREIAGMRQPEDA